jgi:hypothetical protein
MLDPDPDTDEMNADPQPCFKALLFSNADLDCLCETSFWVALSNKYLSVYFLPPFFICYLQ